MTVSLIEPYKRDNYSFSNLSIDVLLSIIKKDNLDMDAHHGGDIDLKSYVDFMILYQFTSCHGSLHAEEFPYLEGVEGVISVYDKQGMLNFFANLIDLFHFADEFKVDPSTGYFKVGYFRVW